jgi:hypothetical protein
MLLLFPKCDEAKYGTVVAELPKRIMLLEEMLSLSLLSLSSLSRQLARLVAP